MKRIIISGFLLTVILLITGCSESTVNDTNHIELKKNPSFSAEYEVTLENLTPAGSQPLSPPVFAVHSPTFRIFHIGSFASDELAQIAQDAFNDPMLTLLNNSDEVYMVLAGSAPIPPGSSETFIISAADNFTKLSFVTMLVNTNDAFTGADKLQLPQSGSKTYYLRSYDAGSEENTELEEHIPGPCCGNTFTGNSTNERIKFHDGITGTGNLDPSIYDWNDPAAKLTITRIN